MNPYATLFVSSPIQRAPLDLFNQTDDIESSCLMVFQVAQSAFQEIPYLPSLISERITGKQAMAQLISIVNAMNKPSVFSFPVPDPSSY